MRGWYLQSMLTVGSSAMGICEPGQVRKEAAVSRSVHVLEECLARVEVQRCHPGRMDRGQVHGSYNASARPAVWSKAVATPHRSVFLYVCNAC